MSSIARERPAVEEAYRHCERVTRHEAANFFYGIRLLPPAKRRAMCAVYAFARRVDDIGDGTLPAERKLAALDGERRGVARLREGRALGTGDPVLVALDDTRTHFDLPLDSLERLIDGVEQDVRGTVYETFEELVFYCGCVAGTIGRLCVAIFGADNQAVAVLRADELGVAMQLTNILRDVREDHGNGRVYLPAEDLRRYGLTTPLAGPDGAIEQLVRFEAARNREWFDRGLQLLPLLDQRSAACVLAMTGIYRRVLERIEQDPLAITRERVSVPAWEKVVVAARSLAGMRTDSPSGRTRGAGWSEARKRARGRGTAR
ncbi:MAG TPA: presqualene diphosphate synthase HpnD [Conexibacter sp.]|jgi:phytoene synthase